MYSIAQAIDPEFDVWFRYGTGRVLGPAEKVDNDYTVDITTLVEAPLLPNLLTVVDMVSPNVSLEEGSHPIGTGPYQFDSYQLNDRLVVDRFDDYWKGPEAYPGISFRIIPETSTRFRRCSPARCPASTGSASKTSSGSTRTRRPR